MSLFVLNSSNSGPALPAGLDTEVQFNDGGVFGGDAAFTFDKVTGHLKVGTVVDSTNVLSFDFNNRKGFNSTDPTNPVINYEICTLFGIGSGVPSVDWTNRRLENGMGFSLEWDFDGNGNTKIYGGGSTTIANFGTQTFYDDLGVNAIQFSTTYRWLLDAGGSMPSIDWAAYHLLNITQSNTVPMLDWSNSASGSVDIYYGIGNYKVASFSSAKLYSPSSAMLTLDWSDRVLYDDYSSTSVNWNFHVLSTVDGTSIHWGQHKLYDITSNESANYDVRTLTTDFSGLSLDWQNRTLNGPSGGATLNWATSNRIGILNASPAAALDVAGTVKLGTGGTVFQKILSATASLNFPSIAANSVAALTMTVTGATTGSSVEVGAPSTLEANLTFCGFVSAANTVTIRVHNGSGGAIDPAAATWRATVTTF